MINEKKTKWAKESLDRHDETSHTLYRRVKHIVLPPKMTWAIKTGDLIESIRFYHFEMRGPICIHLRGPNPTTIMKTITKFSVSLQIIRMKSWSFFISTYQVKTGCPTPLYMEFKSPIRSTLIVLQILTQDNDISFKYFGIFSICMGLSS